MGDGGAVRPPPTVFVQPFPHHHGGGQEHVAAVSPGEQERRGNRESVSLLATNTALSLRDVVKITVTFFLSSLRICKGSLKPRMNPKANCGHGRSVLHGVAAELTLQGSGTFLYGDPNSSHGQAGRINHVPWSSVLPPPGRRKLQTPPSKRRSGLRASHCSRHTNEHRRADDSCISSNGLLRSASVGVPVGKVFRFGGKDVATESFPANASFPLDSAGCQQLQPVYFPLSVVGA